MAEQHGLAGVYFSCASAWPRFCAAIARRGGARRVSTRPFGLAGGRNVGRSRAGRITKPPKSAVVNERSRPYKPGQSREKYAETAERDVEPVNVGIFRLKIGAAPASAWRRGAAAGRPCYIISSHAHLLSSAAHAALCRATSRPAYSELR